ncbi:hypothetical protein Dip510_000831 [Elusimicrobium posterum]|uniref:Bbp16 family capsid cement protein n=1 Tax=Elusimicrobium posterum TaxID=3116653 RepID=UPI003C70E452
MIGDIQLTMSKAFDLTASATSDIIDTGKAGDAETSLWARVSVRESFAGATSLQADVVTSDTEDFAVKTVLLSSGVVLAAALTAGATLINGRLPLGCKRYIRTEYTLAGTATAGKVDSLLVKDTVNPDAALAEAANG